MNDSDITNNKSNTSLDILVQYRDDIVEKWLQKILEQVEVPIEDEADRISLRESLKKFLYILEMVFQEINIDSFRSGIFDHASRIAKEIAVSYPIQGVTQTGSAVFLFSLREVLFPFIKETCRQDPEILGNEMDRINQVVDRLILIGLETYIQARERAATEQSRAMVELAESSANAKSLFLASMSHEIRTPINAILGVGELLAESALNSEQTRFVKIVNKAGETLLALINDILDISKIEAGQLELEVLDFNLAELIQDVIDLLSLQARDKGLALNLEPNPFLKDMWVSGDPTRVQQILLNLLSNAIKFTDQGEVVVRFEQHSDDKIAIFVTDTGIGIPVEKRQYIFQQFTQADASISRQYRGTGLGLAICKQLAEKMRGKIELESEVGVGSVFQVTIPLPSVDPPTYSTPGTLVCAGTTEGLKGDSSPNRLKILLVDDAQENLIIFQAFLNFSGHTINIAEDGAEALMKFQREKYDIVFMDMEMPVMDGYAATKAMRAWEQENGLTPTPIIALSAHAMQEHTQRSLDAGCNHHLTKPIRKAKLLEYIDQFKETNY
ncbi:MAG: response regulator [Magnetococcales bacterium]|nr:response regulator [Magnetococcales bacterium]